MLRPSLRRSRRPGCTLLRVRCFSGGDVLGLLRSGEEQLAALPDAVAAGEAAGELKFRAAAGHQQRVVDIFGAVPDPTLQLVTSRQHAVLLGLLGDYAAEAKLRCAVVGFSATLPAAAKAAAQHELSVSALRAGDLATAATAADAAAEAAAGVGTAAVAICAGWRGTVSAALGETAAAIAQ